MPKPWKNDEELFAMIRSELCTAVLSDAANQLKHSRIVLPSNIKALNRDQFMVGRAMPVQDSSPLSSRLLTSGDAKPFGLLFESIEALKPDEVYISSGGPVTSARMGELLTLRAQKTGAAGLVINAHIRDILAISSFDFPVFSLGSTAYGIGAHHNIIDFRCPITIEDIIIHPGDLVVGDADGVCIIPKEIENDIIKESMKKIQLENKIMQDIEQGGSLLDAFKKHKTM